MDPFRTKRSSGPRVFGHTAGALDLSQATPLTTRGRWGARRAILPAGTTLHLERYTVNGVLGRGGEGIVYRAYDGDRRHHVALKVLHVDDVSAVPLLKREFRFLRDLIHPGLVSLYELIVDAELSFYTMALVDGIDFLSAAGDEASLRKHLLQLAEVLAFLHATSRVHRDIKPKNVLVRPDGQLVLVDFGIGIDLAQQSTRDRGVFGTPRYMAPELLALQQASAKSDAYAVGVMLFEALTGAHPEPNGLPNPSRTRPPRVAERKPGCAGDLCQICEGLLEPDPARRLNLTDVVDRLLDRGVDSGRASGGPWTFGLAAPMSFAGRALELARLEEAFHRVEQEREAVLAVIEAPSGHGKTATLSRFLERHTGALVLRGRCSEHELVAHKAIDGVVECLFEYLQRLEEWERFELVPPEESLLLAQLFPELVEVAGQQSEQVKSSSASGDTRALRVRAYQALARVLGRLGARESLIIAIDDLQWGDADSGKLLLEVFSGPGRPCCLLVLAHRSGEVTKSPCLRELFGHDRQLSDTLVTTQLALRPLQDVEARELVERVLREARPNIEVDRHRELVADIVAEAGGSPLLLTEIALHLSARLSLPGGGKSSPAPGGRVGLDEIVRERCLALTPGAYDAFQLLCCSGAMVDVRLLSEMSQTSPEQLVRELEVGRLARQRAGGMKLEVLHDAIREALLRTIARESRELHTRLARTLESEQGDPAEIARHYAEAGLKESSALWAERAGDAASRSLALDHAVRMYRLALEGTPHGAARWAALLEKLASALADAGFGAQAAPLFEELAARAPEERAMLLRTRAAEQWLITGEAGRGSQLLAEVQERAGLRWPATPTDALRTFLWERARVHFSRWPRRRPRSQPSSALLAQLEACRAAWSVSFISTIHGAANASRYLRLAIQSGDPQHLAIGYGMEAMYLASLGARARDKAQRSLSACRRHMPTPGEGYNAAFLKYATGQCDFLLGDFRLAYDGYADAETAFLATCRNVSWELNSGRIFLGNVLFELGRHRELDRRYADWLADAEERGDSYMGAAIPIAQARRAIIRTGDLQETRRLISAGSARWKSPYMGFHHFSAMVCSSLVALIAQRPMEALDILHEGKRDLRATHMGRVQILRVHFETQAAYAAIELAADCKNRGERRRLLHLAEREAGNLKREGAPHTTVRARLIETSVELLRAPTDAAIGTLRSVEQEFAAIGHELESAAVAGRLSEILGGDEGKALRARAYARFQEADAADWTCALSGFAPRFLASG